MIKDRPILGIGPGNDAFNMVYPLYQRPNLITPSGAYSVFSGGDSGGRVDWSVYLPLAAAGDLHPGLESAPAPARNPGHSGLLAHGCSGFYGGNAGPRPGGYGVVPPPDQHPLVVVYGAGSQLLHGYAGVDEEVAEVSLAQQFESITT